jgi:hypothetical protein
MREPLVTIVTPVLNRVETIEACLASVASQSYEPIEHIVVDGGSTDGTLDLINDHRPSHRFRWISEPDSGMYDAINKGIALSNGDVLAYLNSDDLYLPWSVEVAIRALTPPIDLVYGDMGMLRVEPDGGSGVFSLKFYPDFSLRHYAFVGTIGQPTVFWRRSLTDKIGPFDAGYRLIGDCEYWLRAALRGAKLRHIPELLAIELEHGSTLRTTQGERLKEEFETLRRSMRTFVDPPRHQRWERLKESVVWRIRQLEFFYAMKARSPHKWWHFVTTLHSHGVSVRLQDLRILAPARWRADASLFGDAARVHGILVGLGSL